MRRWPIVVTLAVLAVLLPGVADARYPTVARVPTPSGQGHWEADRDGGVFTFGDARFFGSLGAIPLQQPITSMAAHPSGRGYWLVAGDGGVFAFGAARFFGSLGAAPPSSPITSVEASSTGNGYRLRAADGRTWSFGDAPQQAACSLFPADNPWNTDISRAPVHPRSAAWVASVGTGGRLHPDFGTFWEGGPIGIPYVEVGPNQARVPVRFEYAGESDPGPYPIPPDAPIEGGPSSEGDRHVLVLDRTSCRLWELFAAYPQDGGRSWQAGSGATWDLRSNGLRPDGWTSADAAGLPILPGLVRRDEVAAGEIRHALRFTARRTQRGYIHPATHFASSITDPNVPPMGARFRLKASFDCRPFTREIQVVCTALKRYGMLLADNGADWYVTGTHDPAWNDEAVADLRRIPGSAFEVVDTGPVRT